MSLDESRKNLQQRKEAYARNQEDKGHIREDIAELEALLGVLRLEEVKLQGELIRAEQEYQLELERSMNEPDFNDPNVRAALTLAEADPLWNELRDFQKEGVAWMVDNYERPRQMTGVLLSDDMGLGKTVQAAQLLKVIAQRKRMGSSRKDRLDHVKGVGK